MTFLSGRCACCNGDNNVHAIEVRGKTVHFTFGERFGPLVTDKNGEPLATQPISEKHAFWGPFGIWLERWKREQRRG